VAVATDGGGAAIVAVLERRGTLARRDPAVRDVEQVVAANVDRVVAVFPLDRPLRAAKLERLLVMAHEGGVAPLLLLTKADLAKHEEAARRLVAEVAAGTPLLVTSTVTGAGLDELRAALLPPGTAALVGESGAGKSSLVNELVGADLQAVAEVRARDRKGRHTTVARRLVPLPFGGTLIDTPGVRALGVWSEEGGSVDEAFPDITALAEACRFRDCTHRAEPGCAVRAAVSAGALEGARLDRFQTLAEEYDGLDRRREESDWRHGQSSRRRR
jgi:ribosome biogenesis GTPase